MTEKKKLPDNDTVTMALLAEYDRIIRRLRKYAREADSKAAYNSKEAFVDLQAFLSELVHLVSGTPSSNVSNFHSHVGEGVSGLAVHALRTSNIGQLQELIRAAESRMSEWSPGPRQRNERSWAILGSDEEVRAAWEKEWSEIAALEQPDRQARQRIADAVSAILEFLDQARRNLPCCEQAHGEVDVMYWIRRQPSGAFLVRFEDEMGTIKGEGMDRWVQLCRSKRIDVICLTVDILSLRSAKSIQNVDDDFDSQTERRVAQAMEQGVKESKNLRRVITERLEAIEETLRHRNSSEEQERLREEQTNLEKYRNGIYRVPDSKIKTMRRTVEASLRRLRKECSADLPRFADHIASSRTYDKVRDQFVYDGPEWEFRNF